MAGVLGKTRVFCSSMFVCCLYFSRSSTFFLLPVELVPTVVGDSGFVAPASPAAFLSGSFGHWNAQGDNWMDLDFGLEVGIPQFRIKSEGDTIHDCLFSHLSFFRCRKRCLCNSCTAAKTIDLFGSSVYPVTTWDHVETYSVRVYCHFRFLYHLRVPTEFPERNNRVADEAVKRGRCNFLSLLAVSSDRTTQRVSGSVVWAQIRCHERCVMISSAFFSLERCQSFQVQVWSTWFCFAVEMTGRPLNDSGHHGSFSVLSILSNPAGSYWNAANELTPLPVPNWIEFDFSNEYAVPFFRVQNYAGDITHDGVFRCLFFLGGVGR